MNPITYALATYAITAVISLLTIAVVLLVNAIVSKTDQHDDN